MDDPFRDLLLPLLPHVPPVNSHTNTTVKIKNGFLGKVVFKPWTRFDDRISQMAVKVKKLPSQWTMQARTGLEMVRCEILPITHKSEIYTVAKALKEWNDSQEVPQWSSPAACAGASPLSEADTLPSASPTSQPYDYNHRKELAGCVYSSSTSACGIHFMVFHAVHKLLQAICKNPVLYFLPELTVKSNNFRGLDDATDVCQDSCDVRPDFSLSSVPIRSLDGTMPICTVELKTPTRQICSSPLRCGPLRRCEVRDVFWECEKVFGKGIDVLMHDSHRNEEESFKARFTEKAAEKRREPDCNVERRKRSNLLSSGATTGEIQERGNVSDPHSATEIATFYNKLFSYDPATGATDTSVRRTLFEPVAQVLSQGLQTKTGVCALYTHQELICFQIVPIVSTDPEVVSNTQAAQTRSDDKIVVKVSRCYVSDEVPGNILPLLTLASYSIDVLNGNDDLPMEMRKTFRMVVEAAQDFGKQPKKNSGEVGATKNSSSNEQTWNEAGSGRAGGSTRDDDMLGELFSSIIPDVRTNELETDEGDNSDTLGSGSEEEIQALLQGGRRVIGTGRSATVREYICDGNRFALKIWNRRETSGLKELSNEIQIYKSLQARNSSALGLAMPRFQNAVLNDIDAFLITELVGEGLRTLSDGRIVLGLEDKMQILDLQDILGLQEAAIESLKVIHGNGILHGDIELRNLRAERQSTTNFAKFGSHGQQCKPTWRAWWIDFGRSRNCETGLSSIERVFELSECRAMFSDGLQRVQ